MAKPPAPPTPADVDTDVGTTVRRLRGQWWVVALFSFVINVLMLVPTVYMLQIYDRVMVSRSELTLLAVSLVTLFLFGVLAFSEWSRSQVLVRVSTRFDEMLSARVFRARFEAHLSASDANPARAFSDLTEVRQFLTGPGLLALFDAPWTPIYIIVLFGLHPALGVLAIVFAAIQVVLAGVGHALTKAPAEAAGRSQGEAMAYLGQRLRDAELHESMGMMRGLARRWMALHTQALAQHLRVQRVTQGMTAWGKFFRYTQQSLALGLGAVLVVQGHLTAGGMIAANVLMSRALAPIDLLTASWRGFIAARAAYRRLQKLLAAHPAKPPAQGQRGAPRGDVELYDVTVKVPGRAVALLRDVDFRAIPGTITVILGPSGSGKSTLVRVLLGLWPDVRGEVLLDSEPIAAWDRRALGPHIGYLPQDIELLDGTIAENIARFGKVNPQQVIAATQAAGLHELILRFPKGYDTPVGVAGGLLSAGQVQRIALARALYGEPAVVVLDEPNANLDSVGDQALLKVVLDLRAKGKTVILVSHRSQVMAVADRLFVLEDGHVSAAGAREQVAAQLRTRRTPAHPVDDDGAPQSVMPEWLDTLR